MRERGGMWILDYKQNAYEATVRLATDQAERLPTFWVKVAL